MEFVAEEVAGVVVVSVQVGRSDREKMHWKKKKMRMKMRRRKTEMSSVSLQQLQHLACLLSICTDFPLLGEEDQEEMWAVVVATAPVGQSAIQRLALDRDTERDTAKVVWVLVLCWLQCPSTAVAADAVAAERKS